MKIKSNKLVRILEIECENTQKAKSSMYDYLDRNFGKSKYKVRQSCSHPTKPDTSLAIVEADYMECSK